MKKAKVGQILDAFLYENKKVIISRRYLVHGNFGYYYKFVIEYEGTANNVPKLMRKKKAYKFDINLDNGNLYISYNCDTPFPDEVLEHYKKIERRKLNDN